MALKATIYKADLSLSDMDRNYYASHSLTLAQHPSETLERMMLRIAVFALNASETLAFTRGISVDDEPDLWQHNLAGEIEHWIELGEPDEKRLRRAAGRAAAVTVYSYGGRSGDVWWQQNGDRYARFDNLAVWRIEPETLTALAALCQRGMQLTATVQDGTMWLSDGATTVAIEPAPLKAAR
ncbi:YaeQ family protein [Paludibacterium paludis]|uniref:YaeQ family protein n=1 Tax=Paludibacterium paludis TaxID=1225769 RepID=A0A918P128_9NEIS|nr:YaeQ family protein [Paludibacterium paludis]GGY12679.1 hypothetical protein GCM10011289_14950 [Paludibacterium paludis]